jgi:cytidylate kinase
VTLYVQRSRINPDEQIAVSSLLPNMEIDFLVNPTTGRSDVCLNGENVEKEIRTLSVANNVSQIAKISEVRRFLVALQQKMGAEKGVVMDGRDIGTVVFPNAELKIFMTASPEVRARRRFDELSESGIKTTYEEVLGNIRERDSIDSSRSDSPLTCTDEYMILDNTHMSRDEQFAMAVNWVNSALNG